MSDPMAMRTRPAATAAPEPLFLGHPPAEFHCAAPGTRFILSMEQSSDGRPITWTMQSQEGWDCRIHSSASGDRGLWSNRDDRNNPIRLLWPLQLGKSVPCPCGNGGHLLYRVSSHQEVWLPIGRVDAYGIDEVALNDAGEPIYTITHYWAPSLGFIIGQRAVEQKGSAPDETAPDWQVVAIEPPETAAETGLRIELPSGTN